MPNYDNVYSPKRLYTAISKESGIDEDTVKKVFAATFDAITENVMKGRTVQVENFGTFRLKHLGRRVKSLDMINNPDDYGVSEEHYKVTFLAYADLRRRAQRRLKREIARAERDAYENDDSWSEW